MSQINYDYEEPRSSKVPLITLAARVTTFASLAVAIVILLTNRVTVTNIKGYQVKLTYSNYFRSYEYMFFVSAVGVFYTILQIPFAVFHVIVKHRLIDSYILLKIEFYGDKIISLLLAAGAGAAFLATRDLKEYTLDKESSSVRFFNLNFIAATFIFIGCLGSAISSIFSSLALSKGK